jgi:uncharacterized ion transporter superfamily protein YfcC
MNHPTPTQDIKGLLALLGIWSANIAGFMAQVQQGLQILATIAALVASIAYARYYFQKTKKEKNEGA